MLNISVYYNACVYFTGNDDFTNEFFIDFLEEG